ncbi:hypothetical protein TBLA_0A07400 [Henningerozyma blattae CBS 6284]|uniref:Uncharacterized protein n=1 Tax=Henningerozyma blattae (strain ATCC 34711 / CBS 6284 / DSM 70876 / NBRC 10599 / NRRL Y-10934 / UCD 77-7) TaxID=1071380 RepID=I2GWM8_HENB6|nr:hypothetical protein TBLA_0A07400 [Tetrapisispora blattae CBS 6284]CCH58530.1 hypothetical protein TBLA_0A07400 [Tetrapisispora blattae CBS 6284]
MLPLLSKINGKTIARNYFFALLMLMIIFHVVSYSHRKYSIITGTTKLLFKRGTKWDATKSAVLSGVLISAAATLFTAWKPVLCIVPTAPQCWAMIIGLTVTVLFTCGITARGIFREQFDNGDFDESTVSNILAVKIFTTFLDQYNLKNTTEHTYPVFGLEDSSVVFCQPNELYTDVVSKFVDAGLGVPLLTMTNSSDASIQTNNLTNFITIHWNTNLGKHTATHLEHYSVMEMVSDIIDQFNSGYNGTFQYQPTGKFDIEKEHIERVKVNWVSYNVNENEDPVSEIEIRGSSLDFQEVWDGNIKAFANLFYANHIYDSWKWNIDVVKENTIKASGIIAKLKKLVRKERLFSHGEAYINQYGGISDLD